MKRKNKIGILLMSILLVSFLLGGCYKLNFGKSAELKVHYINVGQGDSILVQDKAHNMLIDTGTNASKEDLISYLKKQNVKKIDYLILTHPHEDHIGGADEVIKNFHIDTIYMPKVTSNTRTFRNVIEIMKDKGLTALEPVPGTKFSLGDASCIIYGPVNTDKEDLNTYSIVLKLTFGSTKFLFTGDAQSSNEKAMIDKGYDLSANVLKLGHHGSHTSSSKEFLKKVSPKFAVVSCGNGNDYGHPHKQVMDRIKQMGIKLFRTDENGTVICSSNGKNISFNCKPGDYLSGDEKNSSK